MTDYTELKARMLAWCDTCTTFGLDSIGQDMKAGLDAIESLEHQIAELSKDAVPVAWGIAAEGEMCDAYIVKDTCVREFDRRNRLYPDTPRVLVELFTHPANAEAAIASVCEQGKRDAVPEDIRKDAERWRAIVAEAERDYVEVPSHEEPYWQRLECTEAMEEWADAAIAAAPKEK